jgi:HD-GYP domain-containing protein (c-di-GMP phosphodiesterase class II)
MAFIRGEVVDITECLPALHRQLSVLLFAGERERDFVARLEHINEDLDDLASRHADDALFVLVQMLSRPELGYGYSACHALMSALLCKIVGPTLGLKPRELTSLSLAALTMNIGMTALHDQLAQQQQAPTESQRRVIAAHPMQGSAMLRQRGVQDPLWLTLVEEHHESRTGHGYPSGKTDLGLPQQLLRMADRFVARITPRTTRSAEPAHRALAQLYNESEEASPALRAAFAKQLGMYPPGTYVKLENDEVAIVVRRGQRVYTPLVMAIADSQGMPHITPKKRKSNEAGHAIKWVLSPSEVRVRIDARRLLKRV